MQSTRRTLGLLALIALATVSPAFADRARRHGPATPSVPARPASPAVDCGPDNFTQSSSLTPTDLNGVTCTDDNDVHFANSWFRSFHLPEYGLLSEFAVCQVNLAIEFAATAGAVGQPMTVNLYTNSGCPFPEET